MKPLGETEFVHPETGEVMTGREICDVVLEEVYRDKKTRFEWIKLFIKALVNLGAIVCSPRFNVVFRFLLNLNLSSNEVGGTYQEISDETGASRATVIRVVNQMYACDYIRPVRRGTWMLNPEIARSGDEGKHLYLLNKFSNLVKSDKRFTSDEPEPEVPSILEKRIEDIMKEGEKNDENQ